MPQVDDRAGRCLERAVQLADALEAQQQAVERIFAGEHPFDGPEALLEDGRIDIQPAAAPGRFAPMARASSSIKSLFRSTYPAVPNPSCIIRSFSR